MTSLADTLDVVAAHLPPALVPPGSWQGTRAAAAQLPAALTAWSYLECRLGAPPVSPDLIVEVRPAARGVLTGRNPALALGDAFRGSPVWERVAELARCWENPRSPLHETVYCLWLEFDVGRHPAGALPLPGVFIGFTPRACTRGTPASRTRMAREALEALLGRPLDAARCAMLRRCHEHLPAGATMMYVGALLPRGDDALRLCPADVPGHALSGYLGAIGWPGERTEVEATAREMAGCRAGAFARDAALLHLDAEEEVLPRLGMEYVFDRRAQLRGGLAERRFLATLVRRGLCTAAEAEALAAFPGWSLERLPHELWRSIVVRRVNHVKLVFDGAGPPQAKAYLVVHNRFWSARTGAATDAQLAAA